MVDPVSALPETRYWLNGEATTRIPADNRGLAFGDGVFRTLLVTGMTPVWLDAQIEILCRDADRLQLAVQSADVRAQIVQAARHATSPFSALRITLWRQSAGRGYAPRGRQSECLVGLSAYEPDRRAAWSVGVSRHAAWPEPFPGIKHLNRLVSVAAAVEAETQGVPEVLLRDGGLMGRGGVWSGGSKTSVYIIKNNIMYIRKTTENGIEGAGIGWITERWQERGIVRVDHLPSLATCDEAGVINSLNGPRAIKAVLSLDTSTAWIGIQPLGPHTKELQKTFAREAGTPTLI